MVMNDMTDDGKAVLQPIDWSAPIEAYHADGRVVPVKFVKDDGSTALPMFVRAELYENEGGMARYFNRDGSRTTKGWRIRNVRPATQTQTLTAQERLERMEAFVRKAAAHVAPWGQYSAVRDHLGEEARALVAEMEPVVDGDLVEARRMVADQYGNSRNVSHLVASALSGDGDEWFHTKVALAAIKRGRELARQTGCPKES